MRRNALITALALMLAVPSGGAALAPVRVHLPAAGIGLPLAPALPAVPYALSAPGPSLVLPTAVNVRLTSSQALPSLPSVSPHRPDRVPPAAAKIRHPFSHIAPEGPWTIEEYLEILKGLEDGALAEGEHPFSHIAPDASRALEEYLKLQKDAEDSGKTDARDQEAVDGEPLGVPESELTPEQKKARERLIGILNRGGAIPQEDRAFVDEWFPRFMGMDLVGRRPAEYERGMVERWFPRLKKNSAWRITADSCRTYNCISWSVGVTDQWLWPGSRVRDFDAFFRQRGYVPLEAGKDPEAAADISLWAKGNGQCTHAARRVGGGWWESKLGALPRILHKPKDLTGSSYGEPIKYYRKALPGELETAASASPGARS